VRPGSLDPPRITQFDQDQLDDHGVHALVEQLHDGAVEVHGTGSPAGEDHYKGGGDPLVEVLDEEPKGLGHVLIYGRRLRLGADVLHRLELQQASHVHVRLSRAGKNTAGTIQSSWRISVPFQASVCISLGPKSNKTIVGHAPK